MPLTSLCTRLGPFINFCYLLVDRATQEAALVDPAWEMDKVTAAVSAAGVTVRYVLLTHAHIDHTNLAARCSNRWNAPVIMSEAERRESGFHLPRLQTINDGDRLRLGSQEIGCLVTPGHTQGSVCYLWEGSILTGDTLFPEGCGICPSDAAADQMFDSMRRLVSLVPPETRIYAGHRFHLANGLTLAESSRRNIYLQIDDREIFRRFRMRPGQTDVMAFKGSTA